MIESFIDNAKEKFHLNDDIYGNIMIAVTEAVNNAIRHGNKNESTKNVTLALTLQDGLIMRELDLIIKICRIQPPQKI